MVKELQTRIALKYDSYANWTKTDVAEKGGNLVLLPGEIGICEIPSVQEGVSNVAPTVLFKVGGAKYTEGEKAGQLMAFKDLPWASATAADVYGWAKAKTVEYDATAQKIIFKNAAGGEIHSLDLTSLATKASVDDLEARIAEIESNIGEGGDFSNNIANIEAALETILGTEGTDEEEGTDGLIKTTADAAKAAAKEYTDAEVLKDRNRLDAIEAKDAIQDTTISEHTTQIATNTAGVASNLAAIGQEASDRAAADAAIEKAYKAADEAINAKIGDLAEGTNLVDAIADAKQAGTDAAAAVKTLTEGTVATHGDDIETLKANLAQEIVDRKAADEALDNRLDTLEVFFEGADADGEGNATLYDALDTLKEIQDYISSEGAAADDMVKDIAANKEAIEDIQDVLNDTVDEAGETIAHGLVSRITQAEADISAAEGAIDVLEAATVGYDGTKTVASAIDEAKQAAEKTASDALATFTTTRMAPAEGRITALEEDVNHTTTGLAATKAIADGAAAAAAEATQGVNALKATVVDGADSNAKLRSDITSLQTLTGGNDGNAKLREDITALQGAVNNETTGLVATYDIATAAKTLAEDNAENIKTNSADIADIVADYLKAADAYIFNCGTASEVVHTKAE
jgi:hypothetical protein